MTGATTGGAILDAVVLRDPVDRRALHPRSGHEWRGEGSDAKRWPVVDGIPFLRTDRHALRAAVLADLDRGDPGSARARLLADQDPFAPVAPPSLDACRALASDVEDRRCGLREAMRRLHHGPVADYFAHRTSTPTFLSGLGLLAQQGRPPGLVVEIACGIGQFLRELSRRDVPTLGLDLVWSKLWLARRFVSGSSMLVCGDAMHPPIERRAAPAAATVFCHDAYYFLPDKAAAAAAFRRLAGPDGRVLIGHAHNARVDQGGVAGTPLDPAGYAAHFPGGSLHDDGEVGVAALRCEAAPARSASELEAAEAVSIAWHATAPAAVDRAPYWRELLHPLPAARLVVNPLLQALDGRLRPAWPSARFAAEYRDAGYLSEPAVTAAEAERMSAASPTDPGRVALARRRVLVDLPEGW